MQRTDRIDMALPPLVGKRDGNATPNGVAMKGDRIPAGRAYAKLRSGNPMHLSNQPQETNQ